MAVRSNFKNMTLCLMVIGLVCSALLAFVNQLTQEPIAAAQEKKTLDALKKVMPDFIAGRIYSALCDAFASEVSARRTAMDSATKNAGEMISDLRLKFNRARQGAITQEITEIVAGAEQ